MFEYSESDYAIKYWSTELSPNPEFTVSISQEDVGLATGTLTDQSYTLLPDDPGTVTLTASIQDGGATAYVNKDIEIALPVENTNLGFIRNSYTGTFLRFDREYPRSSGSPVELFKLVDIYSQRWNFTYVEDGYYKFTLYADNTLALSLPNDNEETSDEVVILETYTGEDAQLWKVTLLSNGNCILRSKLSESYDSDLCLSSVQMSEDKYHLVQSEYSSNQAANMWNLLAVAITSPDGLSYEASMWNVDEIKNNSNCYAYAINNPSNAGENYSTLQQPGRFAECEYTDETPGTPEEYGEAIVYRVQCDFERFEQIYGIDMIFEQTTFEQACPANPSKVPHTNATLYGSCGLVNFTIIYHMCQVFNNKTLKFLKKFLKHLKYELIMYRCEAIICNSCEIDERQGLCLDRCRGAHCASAPASIFEGGGPL